MNTHKKTIQQYQKTVFWSLIALIVGTIFLYALFVYAAIIHTAKRQQIAEASADLQSVISELEFALIDSDKVFTTAYAYEVGFTDVTDLQFIERTAEPRFSYNQ